MSAAIGGYGRMTQLNYLDAGRYSGIKDRSVDLEAVRRELQVIIDAIPTQIHPDQRTAYLDAILHDLEDRDDAAFSHWPEDLYVLALTSIRFLGRNPIGSTTLLSPPHLQTILQHTSLPFPPLSSPFSQPSPSPASSPAIEALKIMANLLVLHPTARDAFIELGGGKALSLALAGKDNTGMLIDAGGTVGEGGGVDGQERVFLLARLAFLGSVDKAEVVREMVDTGDIIDSLCYHLTHLGPEPANHNALAELLKLVMNVVRYYPGKTSIAEEDEWSEKFDPLLQPLMNLFHNLSSTSVSPPLSTTLHALLSFPLLPRNLHIWHSIPEPASPASSTGSVRSLINKISSLGTQSSSKRSTGPTKSTTTLRATADDSTSGLDLSGIPGFLHRARTNSNRSGNSDISSTGKPRTRHIKSISTVSDPTAFPTKVLKILDGWFDAYMPYPLKPDEIDGKVMVDEVLPPVLLLMARAAKGSEEFRKVFKDHLLLHDLSPEAGSLESRRGTLGNILRVMHSSNHFSSRDSAGEFLWCVCDSDATTLTAEIGYGNAAGFLFQKGITTPPSGKIQSIPDSTPSPALSHTRTSTSSTSNISTTPRHPISGLSEPLPQSSDISMTPEEKERESERLFVLFERMEKNPIIRLTPEDPANPGSGKGKGVKELMADKLNSGAFEGQDREDEEMERREREDEERKDEEEVARELARYRSRMKGLGREGGGS